MRFEKSYEDHLREQRRFLVLKLLSERPDEEAESGIIHLALEGARKGCTYDQLLGDLVWLEEQGLISLERDQGEVFAKLGLRGRDVAMRRTKYPGIMPPVRL